MGSCLEIDLEIIIISFLNSSLKVLNWSVKVLNILSNLKEERLFEILRNIESAKAFKDALFELSSIIFSKSIKKSKAFILGFIEAALSKVFNAEYLKTFRSLINKILRLSIANGNKVFLKMGVSITPLAASRITDSCWCFWRHCSK